MRAQNNVSQIITGEGTFIKEIGIDTAVNSNSKELKNLGHVAISPAMFKRIEQWKY